MAMEPEDPNIITKINKARVKIDGTGLFDDTDDSGNYFIPGITPGSYTVIADYTNGTNLPNVAYYSGNSKLDGEDKDNDWDWNSTVISVRYVTITAGVTTTLDFILFGY